MNTIAARLQKQYPASNSKIGISVTPLLENQVGQYRGSLGLLLGAVGLVLLIACANLANLLAARGAARAREFAVRAAVGASRWQIVRQLLVESLVLAGIGGALGLGFAAWSRDLLVRLAPRQTGFLAEGLPEPPPGQLPSVEMSVVSGDYFATLKTALLRGRVFDARDTKDAPLVVIVDQLLAERYFPEQNPIGKRLRMSTDEKAGRQFYTIVGVVPHLKVYGFEEPVSLPQAYLPILQQPQSTLVILARTSQSPQVLGPSLRRIVASLDPAQPAWEVRTMQDRVEETWATPRLTSFLLTAFAGLALTLAVIGLYGVMAYHGVRRTREIGVRLALGAQRLQVCTMILRQGVRLLALGLLIGFGGAIALSRLIRNLLFGVNPADPTIYLGVSLLLAAAASLACWIPARRASRVDPMVTLRAE